MKRFWIGIAGLVLVVGSGCLSIPDLCENLACLGSGTDGGADGQLVPEGSISDAKPDADPIPTECQTPTDPTKNPEKCLVDSFGVFVSPTGDDAKDGSKANPFKTIAKALSTTRSRIVVCEGEYTGSLDIGRAVEVYGGVACDFAKAGAKAKIVASKPAYGIKVSKVVAGVILADLDVVGMNGAVPSESSVGIFVSESADVKVLRSRVEAGDGADAPAKKDGAFAMTAQAPKGGDAVANTGGVSASSGVCPGGGTSIGGKGGDSGFQGDDGSPRPPGGAKGGPTVDCSAVAGVGSPGTAGTDRSGAATVASLAPTGLSGSKGQDGQPGTIGGGGGGGYGTMGAGGAGGAGGCGGQGGFGGGPGGSSIAVLSFASTVTLQSVELVAKAAKPGGAGGAGQVGQAGGFSGNKSGGACSGGNGAKGGDGGGGGGGAGGIAAGIAWAGGSEPKRDAQTKIARPTGTGPAGGEGGAVTNKGVDGVHADVFEVK
jgi:hypothetical protein